MIQTMTMLYSESLLLSVQRWWLKRPQSERKHELCDVEISFCLLHYWEVCSNGGTPKLKGYKGKQHLMDDLEVPLFQETYNYSCSCQLCFGSQIEWIRCTTCSHGHIWRCARMNMNARTSYMGICGRADRSIGLSVNHDTNLMRIIT